MEETVDNIKAYCGYFISDKGDVFNRKGKKLKTRLNEEGYPCVSLSINNKNVYKKVHRIVAEVFIPNAENKPCVNHKDRVRDNPSVSNLEWVTYSENVIHSVNNGGRVGFKRNNTGERNPRAKLNFKLIEAIRDLYKIGYSQNDLVKIFNIPQTRINKIVNLKIWKSKN